MKLHKSLWRYGRALFIAGFTLADTGTSAYFKLERYASEDNAPINLPEPVRYAFVGAQMACALFVSVRSTVERLVELDLADRSIDEVYRLLHELECLESDYAQAQLLGLTDTTLENFLLNRIIQREGWYRAYDGSDALKYRDRELVFQLRRKFLARRLHILPQYLEENIKSHSPNYTVAPVLAVAPNSCRPIKPMLSRLDAYAGGEHESPFFNLDINAKAFTLHEQTLESMYSMTQCLMNIKLKLRTLLLKHPLNSAFSVEQLIADPEFKKILEAETKRYLLKVSDTQNIFLFHEHIRHILQKEVNELEQTRKQGILDRKSELKRLLAKRNERDRNYLERVRRLARYSARLTRDYYDHTDTKPNEHYEARTYLSSNRLKVAFDKDEKLAIELITDSFQITKEKDQILRDEAKHFSAEQHANALIKDQHQRRPIQDKDLAGGGEKAMRAVGIGFAIVNVLVFSMMAGFGAFAIFSPVGLGLGIAAAGIFGFVQACVSFKWAWPKVMSVFTDLGRLIDDQYTQCRKEHDKGKAILHTIGHIFLKMAKKLKSPLNLAILVFVGVKQPLFFYAVHKTLFFLSFAAFPVAITLVALTSVSTLFFNYRQIKKKGLNFSPRAALEKAKNSYREGKFGNFMVGVALGTAMAAMTAFTKAAGDFFGFDSSVSSNIIACISVAAISYVGNLLFNFTDTIKGISDTASWIGKKVSHLFGKGKVKKPGLITNKVPEANAPNGSYCTALKGLVLDRPATELSVPAAKQTMPLSGFEPPFSHDWLGDKSKLVMPSLSEALGSSLSDLTLTVHQSGIRNTIRAT